MKLRFTKFVVLMVLVALTTYMSTAQTARWKYNGLRGSWTVGIDGGMACVDNRDIAHLPGWGAGITVARNIWHRDRGLLDVDIRGRLMYARMTGQDYTQPLNTNVDPLFNGQQHEEINYTDKAFYRNYLTHVGELHGELVLTANRLRERTGVVLQGFGGIGFDLTPSYYDQLDWDGSIYDYTGFDDTDRSKWATQRDIRSIRDRNYETDVELYSNVGTLALIQPALGGAIGYQVTPHFALGVEHKVNWALHDYMDGHASDAKVSTLQDSPTNDKWRYTSLWLRWNLGRDEEDYTEPVQGSAPCEFPAEVTITSPSKEYTSFTSEVSVTATVKQVSSEKEILLTVNGQATERFRFVKEGSGGRIVSRLTLPAGRSTIVVRVRNKKGCEASDEVHVNVTNNTTVTPPVVTPVPVTPTPVTPPVTNQPCPRVNITSPNDRGETRNDRISVQATISNAQYVQQVRLLVNGSSSRDFDFDQYRGTFIGNVNLRAGSNTIQIEAVNASNCEDTETISYTYICEYPGTTPPTSACPTVTINQPYNDPYKTNQKSVNINATLNNVDSNNDIRWSVNGRQSTSYSFNRNNGSFTATVNLENGNNVIKIEAYNNGCSDVETRTIIYETGSGPIVPTPGGNPPQQDSYPPDVTITNPYDNPYTSTTELTTINATIKYVTSKENVKFILNGSPVGRFDYNNGNFKASIKLNPGSNQLSITGTNSKGSDTDSRTIIYSNVVKPTVDITQPANNSTSSTNSAPIVATVSGVTSSSQITVSVNSTNTTNFTYTNGTVTANIPLNTGNNTVIVTATNSVGSASDNVSINYQPEVKPEPPVVNITRPNSNIEVEATTYKVIATVTNVTTKQDITFTVNGVPVRSFTYDRGTETVAGEINLTTGTNTIVITGTNKVGTDSDSHAITVKSPNTTPPVTTTPPVIGTPTTPKPTVNITIPVANPYTTYDAATALTAITTNVKSKSNILFIFKGQSITDFNFDDKTQTITANLPLEIGDNNVSIKVTNKAGSATDAQAIKRETSSAPIIPVPGGGGGTNPPAPRPDGQDRGGATPTTTPATTTPRTKPTIDLPSGYIRATNPKYQLTTNVGDVNTNELSIFVNGRSVSNFTISKGQLNATVPLTQGINNIEVKAENTAGKDNATMKVVYSAAKGAQVIVLNPTESSRTVRKESFEVTAMLFNATKQDVTVTANGNPLNFTVNGNGILTTTVPISGVVKVEIGVAGGNTASLELIKK